MSAWYLVVLAGLGVGVSMGLFGVGGSSLATPVLSLLGAPAFAAVASPLPATIPAAVLGAASYARASQVRWRTAAWSLVGGVPGTIAGALLSRVAGGPLLLLASGVVLGAVGLRVLRPIGQQARDAGSQRRRNRPLLVAFAAGVGIFTGLLANGGGFLLVPVYLLVFGLRTHEASGTSLIVVAALTVPTLLAHLALGHVDWALAGLFAAGLVPGAAAGGHWAQRLDSATIRRALGRFLVLFGMAFVAFRLARG